MRKYNTNTQGFTLVELLVSLAVFSILIAIAAPNFSNMATGNKITADLNKLIGALAFAKDEAGVRDANISVISTGGNWQKGWSVQLADGTVLLQGEAMSPNIAVINGVGITTLTFDNSTGGLTPPLGVALVFCDNTVTLANTRGKVLNLLPSGSISVISTGGTCPAY